MLARPRIKVLWWIGIPGFFQSRISLGAESISLSARNESTRFVHERVLATIINRERNPTANTIGTSVLAQNDNRRDSWLGINPYVTRCSSTAIGSLRMSKGNSRVRARATIPRRSVYELDSFNLSPKEEFSFEKGTSSKGFSFSPAEFQYLDLCKEATALLWSQGTSQRQRNESFLRDEAC